MIAEEDRLERGACLRWGAWRGLQIRSTGRPTGTMWRAAGTRSNRSADDLGLAWKAELGGRLSALTIADGRVFVSQIDAHTVHALAAGRWSAGCGILSPGARVDSPPTYWNGRVLFGCSDGNVYCLRASDGELVWRFRAAPGDRRTMVFEQLESLWPVPGSVLVEDGVVSFRGWALSLPRRRDAFLPARGGERQSARAQGDRRPRPRVRGDLQDRIQTLQMPVALNDILSSDGKLTYLRSQKIEKDGERIEIGPVSGNASAQGAKQSGEGAHVFAPMGFLDDTWFHRSYWVYGRNFAGGHNGYHQAGKFAPSGRILVFNDDKVFGYGREPQYYKWTTTLGAPVVFGEPRDPGSLRQGPGAERVKLSARGRGDGCAGRVRERRTDRPDWQGADSRGVDPGRREERSGARARRPGQRVCARAGAEPASLPRAQRRSLTVARA